MLRLPMPNRTIVGLLTCAIPTERMNESQLQAFVRRKVDFGRTLRVHYQHLAVERRTKTVSRLLHIPPDVHLPLLPVIGRPLGRNRYYHLQQHQL